MTVNNIDRRMRAMGKTYFKVSSAPILVGALFLTLLAAPTLAQTDYSDVWTPERETRPTVRNCGSDAAPWPCDATHPPLRPDLVPAPRAVKVFDPARHPDFTGRWLQDQGVKFTDPTPLHGSGAHPGWDNSIIPAPLNPEYQRRYEQSQTPEAIAARAAAAPANPTCSPPRMPTALRPFTTEIAYGDDRMFIIGEVGSTVRRIYLDGRPHPGLDDFDPAWMGHSIGHWEGDALVIDTTMISDELGISIQGQEVPATANLRTVERMRLIDGGEKIELMITFHNPDVFTRPWTLRRTWTRQRSDVDVVEYECQTYTGNE